MKPDWRWHPVTRTVAGVLGLALLTGAIAAVAMAVASLRANTWRTAAISVVAIPAFVLGRLFFAGAWTGEEPPIAMEDDADHPAA